jgi:hypothetical protein
METGLITGSVETYVEEDQEEEGQAASLEGQPRQATQHGARLTDTPETPPSGARLVELDLGGSREAWARAGLHFDTDQRCDVVSLALRIDHSREPGLHGWAFSGINAVQIDGIPSRRAEHSTALHHPIGGFTLDVMGVDHVVVMTPDLKRTSEALANATGSPLKRVREAGDSVRQGFHRVGDVVIEIVSSPQVPEGPARLWGFVLTVRSLEAAADHLGPDVLSPPKPAVQEGRMIATFRQAAGLGVPVALMNLPR